MTSYGQYFLYGEELFEEFGDLLVQQSSSVNPQDLLAIPQGSERAPASSSSIPISTDDRAANSSSNANGLDHGCGGGCIGGISGSHKCFREGDRVDILCSICDKSFATTICFNYHFDSSHPPSDIAMTKQLYCPHPGCPRTKPFTRASNLKQHLQNVHGRLFRTLRKLKNRKA